MREGHTSYFKLLIGATNPCHLIAAIRTIVDFNNSDESDENENEMSDVFLYYGPLLSNPIWPDPDPDPDGIVPFAWYTTSPRSCWNKRRFGAAKI